MGAACGVKVEMILMTWGLEHPKTGLGCSEPTRQGLSPAPVQLTMSIFSNTTSQAHWKEEAGKERNTERREKRRRVSVLYHGYLYPSSDSHQPTRHPLSLCPCRHPPFALFKSLRTRTSTPFLWISPDPIFTLFPLPFPTSARWRNHEEMSNLPTVRI